MNGHEFTMSLQKGNDYIKYQSKVCKSSFEESKKWAERDLQEVIDIFFPECTVQDFTISTAGTREIECNNTVTSYTIMKFNSNKINDYTGLKGDWEEVLSDTVVQKENL